MELRLAIAYSLLAGLAMGTLIAGLVYRSKRAKRLRRLRGIKTDEVARMQRQRAA